MTDDVTVAASVAITIRRELEEDLVGLWKVPWHIRRQLPEASDERVQRIAAGILEALLASDVAVGSLDETTGSFEPWPPDTSLETVMSTWRDAGRDPNIGEVAWLASAG